MDGILKAQSHSWPEELDAFASRIGQDRNLTQGPGGNISLKRDGVLWIKASGTQLKDAQVSPIFVGLDLEDVRHNMAAGYEVFTPKYGLSENNKLRASIETAMHAQIDKPYVAHVHSVGAVGISILRNHDAALGTAREYCDVAYVPYVKPGVKLAKALAEVVRKETKAALLGNHGLTVWAETSEECLHTISILEEIWSDSGGIAKEKDDSERKKPDSELWRNVLSSGILVPDEIVFLGGDPFSRTWNSSSAFELLNPDIRDKVKQSNWLGDFVEVLELIARNVRDLKNVHYLSDREISELVDWDAEKYRLEIK